MNTFKYKTNMKCDGCVATVTPHLNKLEQTSWQVDLKNPDRVLTVETNKPSSEIENAVKEAGFKLFPL